MIVTTNAVNRVNIKRSQLLLENHTLIDIYFFLVLFTNKMTILFELLCKFNEISNILGKL